MERRPWGSSGKCKYVSYSLDVCMYQNTNRTLVIYSFILIVSKEKKKRYICHYKELEVVIIVNSLGRNAHCVMVIMVQTLILSCG